MTSMLQPSDKAVLAAASGQGLRQATLLGDLAQLTKPRIAALVVLTAFVGWALARPSGAASSAGALAAALLGIGLACMGAAVLNQVLERDTDALMRRTCRRPLPAGRMSSRVGLVFGLSLSLGGVAILAFYANLLSASFCAFTIASYIALYTPAKRLTSFSTLIGAVPGAMPPMIGYAAATGSVGWMGWWVFALMFLWQVPHFLAIAWLYRDDYGRAGMPMPPVLDPTGGSTVRRAVIGCIALVPLSLLPVWGKIAGMPYAAGALACSLGFLALAIVWSRTRTDRWARILFIASLVYLPAVLTLVLWNRA